MKFSIPTAELRAALAPVARIAVRASTPTLSGALVRVSGTRVTFTGFDQSVSVLTSADVTDSVDGEVLVPAGLLTQLVGSMAGQSTTLDSTNDLTDLTITSGTAKTKLHTLPAADYPKIPTPTGAVSTLKNADLLGALAAVHYAVSGDESRGVLAGLCFDTSKDPAVLVATDSLRMACAAVPALNALGSASIIVPGRVLKEVLRTPRDEDVAISFDENLIQFKFSRLSLTGRLIAGDFPAWRPIMEVSRERTLTVNTSDLSESIKRVEPLAKESNNIEVKLSEGLVTITASGPNGTITDTVEVDYTGETFTFRVNPHYLLEALAAVGTSEADIKFTADPAKPLEVRRSGSDEVRELLMPIRVS
jgi:DNA polymerase-3 subunit beta